MASVWGHPEVHK